jgi:heavy metal efflux system protein
MICAVSRFRMLNRPAILLFIPVVLTGQNLSVDECISIALRNNEEVKAAILETSYEKRMKTSAFEIPKTSFVYTQGQFNSIYKYDNNITVAQTFPFPGVLFAQSRLADANIRSSNFRLKAVEAEIRWKVKHGYYTMLYAVKANELYKREDSLYAALMKLETEKSLGQNADNLEFITTLSQAYLVKTLVVEGDRQIATEKLELEKLLREKDVKVLSLPVTMTVLETDTTLSEYEQHPHLALMKEQITVHVMMRRTERSKGAPDLMIGYFNQSIYGPANIFGSDYFLTTADRLQGFQVGVSIPLFFTPHHAKVKGADIRLQTAKLQFEKHFAEMEIRYKETVSRYNMTKKNLSYYRSFLLQNAKKIITQAGEAFTLKKINYIDYLNLMSRALEIERNYLKLVLENNLAVAELEYLTSK